MRNIYTGLEQPHHDLDFESSWTFLVQGIIAILKNKFVEKIKVGFVFNSKSFSSYDFTIREISQEKKKLQ